MQKTCKGNVIRKTRCQRTILTKPVTPKRCFVNKVMLPAVLPAEYSRTSPTESLDWIAIRNVFPEAIVQVTTAISRPFNAVLTLALLLSSVAIKSVNSWLPTKGQIA